MKRFLKSENGQVITEYALMLFSCVMIAVMIVFLISIFTEYGVRLINLINIDY